MGHKIRQKPVKYKLCGMLIIQGLSSFRDQSDHFQMEIICTFFSNVYKSLFQKDYQTVIISRLPEGLLSFAINEARSLWPCILWNNL